MFLSTILSNGLVYAVLYLLALVVALTIHEFSHAWAASQLGDQTARNAGRLTLNPLKHLDPTGTVFLLLLGFGWGKPVPINPGRFKRKSDEIIVAMAGIFSNLLLATVVIIPVKVALGQGIDVFASPLLYFYSMLFIINIILAVFNLLPIPPLDGSHIVEHFLSFENKLYYESYGPYLLIAYLVIDQFTGTSILLRVIEPVVNFIAGSQIFNLFFK